MATGDAVVEWNTARSLSTMLEPSGAAELLDSGVGGEGGTAQFLHLQQQHSKQQSVHASRQLNDGPNASSISLARFGDAVLPNHFTQRRRTVSSPSSVSRLNEMGFGLSALKSMPPMTEDQQNAHIVFQAADRETGRMCSSSQLSLDQDFPYESLEALHQSQFDARLSPQLIYRPDGLPPAVPFQRQMKGSQPLMTPEPLDGSIGGSYFYPMTTPIGLEGPLGISDMNAPSNIAGTPSSNGSLYSSSMASQYTGMDLPPRSASVSSNGVSISNPYASTDLHQVNSSNGSGNIQVRPRPSFDSISPLGLSGIWGAPDRTVAYPLSNLTSSSASFGNVQQQHQPQQQQSVHCTNTVPSVGRSSPMSTVTSTSTSMGCGIMVSLPRTTLSPANGGFRTAEGDEADTVPCDDAEEGIASLLPSCILESASAGFPPQQHIQNTQHNNLQQHPQMLPSFNSMLYMGDVGGNVLGFGDGSYDGDRVGRFGGLGGLGGLDDQFERIDFFGRHCESDSAYPGDKFKRASLILGGNGIIDGPGGGGGLSGNLMGHDQLPSSGLVNMGGNRSGQLLTQFSRMPDPCLSMNFTHSSQNGQQTGSGRMGGSGGGFDNGGDAAVASAAEPSLPIVREIQTSKLRVDEKRLTREYFESLTREALEICAQMCPTPDERRRQEDLFIVVQDIATRVFKYGTLHHYGSTANGFALSNADMDLCISLPDPSKYHIPQCVEKLGHALKQAGMKDVKMLTRSRVPIVKMRDPVTGIRCDVAFQNNMALYNTMLLKTYAQIDVRFRELVYIVKHWSKRRNINEASSYCYVLMVIHLLQIRNVLPCLQRICPDGSLAPPAPVHPTMTAQPGFPPVIDVEGNNVYFFDSLTELPRHWSSTNTESLGELIVAFFKYFSSEFPYVHGVASIRAGRVLSKEEKGWTKERQQELNRSGGVKDRFWLCVEDPFEVTNNVGRPVDKEQLYEIRGEFIRASKILCGGSAGEKLLAKISEKQGPTQKRPNGMGGAGMAGGGGGLGMAMGGVGNGMGMGIGMGMGMGGMGGRKF